MGWKTSLIIVNKPIPIEPEKLLKDFGFKRLTKKEDSTLENAFSYKFNKIYIGHYKGNLIISDWKNVEKTIINNDSKFEKLIISKFPQSEICLLELVSTINFSAYKIIKNGKVIRTRIVHGDITQTKSQLFIEPYC